MFYDELAPKHISFIKEQHLFFVATAPKEGRINLSPKGMDSFRVIDSQHVSWLNLTGSGNETAAHLMENGRITVMMCAFEGQPKILRIYGTGTCTHPRDAQWAREIARFPDYKNARQIINIRITSVQTSCGFAVPYFTYEGEREELNAWTDKRSKEEIEKYWAQRNSTSIDGQETGI